MLERLWCRKTGTIYIPPSEPTIRRQLQRIDAEKVDMAISDWVGRLSSGAAIGIDGKTLKGARRQDGSKVHLLSAFIHQQGITIALKEVSAKSNEIPSAIPLLWAGRLYRTPRRNPQNRQKTKRNRLPDHQPETRQSVAETTPGTQQGTLEHRKQKAIMSAILPSMKIVPKYEQRPKNNGHSPQSCHQPLTNGEIRQYC